MTAMVTPFDANGALDIEGARTLARYLIAHGNDGLVVNGTTGESPTLTQDEHNELIAAVVDAIDAPVLQVQAEREATLEVARAAPS